MKKGLKRCPRCRKKDTLHDIFIEMIQINPFTSRSYSGIECHSCGWNNKAYVFKDVQEKRKEPNLND